MKVVSIVRLFFRRPLSRFVFFLLFSSLFLFFFFLFSSKHTLFLFFFLKNSRGAPLLCILLLLPPSLASPIPSQTPSFSPQTSEHAPARAVAAETSREERALSEGGELPFEENKKKVGGLLLLLGGLFAFDVEKRKKRRSEAKRSEKGEARHWNRERRNGFVVNFFSFLSITKLLSILSPCLRST